MVHDPLVCVEDAINACELILEFTHSMKEVDYYVDARTKAAVERKFEIIGEALNRIKKIDHEILAEIDNWREIQSYHAGAWEPGGNMSYLIEIAICPALSW